LALFAREKRIYSFDIPKGALLGIALSKYRAILKTVSGGSVVNGSSYLYLSLEGYRELLFYLPHLER
jgi:hypothetical protein